MTKTIWSFLFRFHSCIAQSKGKADISSLLIVVGSVLVVIALRPMTEVDQQRYKITIILH